MKGKSIIVPRISFAEKRKRHSVLSHHTITLLSELITDPVEIAVPDNPVLRKSVLKQDWKKNIILIIIRQMKFKAS